MSEFPLITWVTIDGRQVPFTKPQHFDEIGNSLETGKKNPLPTHDELVKAAIEALEAKQTELNTKIDTLTQATTSNKTVGINNFPSNQAVSDAELLAELQATKAELILLKTRLEGTFKIGNLPEVQSVSDTNVLEKLAAVELKLDAVNNRLNQTLDMQLKSSTTELDISRIDELITNQREIINVMNSDKLIFGSLWDKSSNSIMTRTDAAVGMIAEVGVDGQLVRNDFDRAPIFGEIEDVIDEYGNEFTRIPKFYIRKLSGKDFYLVQVSKTRYPGFYLPWVFWDFENSKELPYYDHAKYNASLSDDGLRLESKPNRHPLVSKNIVQFREYAQANNDEVTGASGYQQLDIHARDILSTLFRVEFATLDSQSIMKGFTNGQYSESHLATVAELATNRIIVANSTADAFLVGQPISIGTSRGGNQIFYGRDIVSIDVHDADNKAIVFDGDPVDIEVGNIVYNTGWKSGFSKDILASSGSIGSNTDGKHPCMYRGIENPWGNVWLFVDGVNFNDNQAWVAKNANDYASNVFAFPYEELGYINSAENGYPTEMGFDSHLPFAEFPVTLGGGSTTYYADYYYQNTGQRIAHVGGYWFSGSTAGLSCWALSYSSAYASVTFGGRLLKKAS